MSRAAMATLAARPEWKEDVLVKRRWGRPLFEVSLVSSTVKDVRINFDRE